MQKVLITGAAGMLGYKIASYFFEHKNFKVTGTGRSNISPLFTYIKTNLTNTQELKNLLALVKPDIIIHCAAIVNLNECEEHKDEAYELHVHVTQKLASYNAAKCRFIYISTDSVFDGTKENYTETDTTSPLNYYAFTKLRGEEIAINSNKNTLVLRTNIYGFNINKNGSSLFEWLYKSLSNRTTVSGFGDVFFNPLYTGQLADLVMLLIEKNITGYMHCGCNENISKFQFAEMIAAAFALDTSFIKNNSSDTMVSVVKRPKNTTLSVEKLHNITGKSYSINDGINKLKTDFFQQKKLYG